MPTPAPIPGIYYDQRSHATCTRACRLIRQLELAGVQPIHGASKEVSVRSFACLKTKMRPLYTFVLRETNELFPRGHVHTRITRRTYRVGVEVHAKVPVVT